MSELAKELGAHAGDKCIVAIKDAMALADDKVDKAKIALMALGMVAGAAGGAFANAHLEETAVKNMRDAQREFTCAVLDLAKSIVVKGPDRALAGALRRPRP